MWSEMVVVVSPLGKFDPDLMQATEQGLVQLLASQASIKASDEDILHGLSRHNRRCW
jgi:hypothetical protein